VSRQDISQIERKGRIPHPDALRWLAHALEVPVERVVGAAEQQRVKRRYAKSVAALDRLDMVLVVARSAASGDEDRSEGVISSARRPTTGLGPRIEE
jgi:transcriptional regulator with XRE-family HTH domain